MARIKESEQDYTISAELIHLMQSSIKTGALKTGATYSG
jgi:hypothetical protein